MKPLLCVGLLLAVIYNVTGQDTGWLVDEAPLVSAVMVKSVEKSAAFSARINVTVSGADLPPSTASGTIECQNGAIRWEVRLGDVKSAQLTQSARAVVRQVNGDQFLLITRPDLHTNYLVLSGSQACLEQPLPSLKLSPRKVPPMTETFDGHLCSREASSAVRPGAAPAEVYIWKAKDLKGVPSQIQLTDSGETVLLTLSDIRLRPISTERFRVPDGLASYSSMEDLVQSVLISKMKRRMGIE